MDTKVLIIGAGHAGIETAASLRNLGFSGKIEIFDQENTLPVSYTHLTLPTR